MPKRARPSRPPFASCAQGDAEATRRRSLGAAPVIAGSELPMR
ncbi:protein of unassigned function [Methylobacterium oryzae CBMB20]|uniref:Protein of unassigned function n=1 Tax=Methylobacterium oryzae CBMB20 TaxID=693986 RepID=A0A089NQN3_9HYPH|nr:protein of unassigned function [Methylobacterium oryzae CBMB20]